MAVYTEVTDDELSRLIADYGLGELLSYKGIAEGVENTNYMVHTSEGTFILTLYERRVDTRDLPFFLGLLEHLNQRGIRCPLPVHNKQGQVLSEISDRTAAVVTFLEGVWPRRPRAVHCTAVGQALAGLHLAGKDFAMKRTNALSLEGWHDLYDRIAARADEIARGLGDLIAYELAYLDRAWPRDLPSGVIHADLFPDNVFFIGENLSGLIDFYFACNDSWAYDLSICLNAWCFEPDFSFNATKSRALLAAYQAVRPLTAAERLAFPVLARGAALRFLLTRAHDWLHTDRNALVKPHDPNAYVRRLRFHQEVKSPSEYGLEAAS
ncbi:homoserine kinase [Hyphomicrobium sp.]|uniref:homoserine kinase n=1 Tax=Hyphomicrobium sp. TaxID=82 RepID=UPI002E344211|nr:homoserine kinase [Hyphomicrobium sp.]HEX2841964.1 homoserine kinase [Hyphomicrobium sp.]